ncbi:TonB-dependent receptor [Carboxylicivirga sp. A043]|uniref:SusC/RagA family TonB-linked outer membrane protein n=1 Tax=Carboxylicivirga litoralis TaxID=2816963 RepID=UPI0021CB6273|nr:TonB-dependent receptor [Carboxylicivirga sp. A043]MCU4157105.1 TonB-dependent receptor [Carboxylicivirga sp. A043]
MKRKILLSILMVAGFCTQLLAQVVVTGNVTDATDGSPIIGANIVEKGTTNGTITDVNGNYSLTVADENSIVIFSFIGYSNQEITVGTQTTIDAVLATDAADLDEVVVVGYGVQKKSHLTGAIAKVKNEGLDQVAVSQASEALVGKVSGVTIQTTDGTAGSEPTIRVRGVGSISADASPLIVVDGVVADFSEVNMNDVESIEVLKDAASAAIYGSRGGNGVIMITTKSGKEGKTVFSVNSYAGIRYTPKYEDTFATVSEWNEVVKANNGGELTDRMKYINELGTETDWRDVMFDGGMVQNYSLSARGGSENVKYYISGGYLDDEGVLLTDEFQKVNLLAKVDAKVNDWLTVGTRIAPTYSEKRDFPIGIHDAVRQSPWLPIRHTEHTIQYVDRNKYPDVQVGDYTFERHFDNYDFYGNGSDVDISTTSNANPYAKVVERDERLYDFRLSTNSYLKFKLAKGLNFKTSLALNYRVKQDVEFQGSEAHRNGSSAMYSANDVDIYKKTVNENIFSYNRTLGDHEVSAVAGFAFEKWENKYSDMQGTGYEFDYIKTINAASVKSQAETFETSETLHSIISRMNYAYKGKYLASFSARWDGSSRFGEDTRYGFFPAGSFGWRVSEEDFLSSSELISNLKLSASYGLTGNKNGINLYQYLSNLQPTTAVIDGSKVTGFNPMNIANPNLGWEQSEEINLAVSLGLWNNRLNFNVDVYERNSVDLLLEQPMPGVTGFESATVNIGEVRNRGVELAVDGLILNNSLIKWDASANLTLNENELVDYADASGEINYIDSKRPAEYIALVGYPISSYYGYVYEKDIPQEYIKNPNYPINAESQDVYVKDLNGDGFIDEDDRAILGSPYPTVVWGVTNNFKVKNIDFSFTFQGSHGGKVRNMDPQYINNQFAGNMDYTSDFPDADKVVERIYTDKFVQDASYVTLRTINLGYALPKSWISRVGLSKARLYVSGQNLIYLMADDYTSFNPEGVTDDSNPLMGGYQRGAAPIAKTITFGVNLDF